MHDVCKFEGLQSIVGICDWLLLIVDECDRLLSVVGVRDWLPLVINACNWLSVRDIQMIGSYQFSVYM